MTKVFISQPMNGKTVKQIEEDRKHAITLAREHINDEIEIISSYFENYNPDKGCIPMKYLAKSIEMLADADVAVFVKGWNTTRGCLIEFQCARSYGIKMIIEEEEFEDENNQD